MTTNAAGKSIVLGDPAPWFGAPLIGDGTFNLQVAAGRWIVLSFLGSPADPRADQELSNLLRDTQLSTRTRSFSAASSPRRRKTRRLMWP